MLLELLLVGEEPEELVGELLPLVVPLVYFATADALDQRHLVLAVQMAVTDILEPLEGMVQHLLVEVAGIGPAVFVVDRVAVASCSTIEYVDAAAGAPKEQDLGQDFCVNSCQIPVAKQKRVLFDCVGWMLGKWKPVGLLIPGVFATHFDVP